MSRLGFTLLELIVVVVIVGILVTLGLVNYGGIKERTLDKEATVNLKLIQAAEKIYRMENTFYYPYSGTVDTSAINTNLKLSLTTAANRNWDYSIPTVQSGTSTASRAGAGGRTWTLTISGDEPVCSGTGCP